MEEYDIIILLLLPSKHIISKNSHSSSYSDRLVTNVCTSPYDRNAEQVYFTVRIYELWW